MSYAERKLRKLYQAKTPAQIHYGRCRICTVWIKPCGPNCIHRRLNRCAEHVPRGDE